MTASSIIETVVLHLKPGVNLEDAAPESASPAVRAFARLTDTLKAQPGFIRQFWGHQIEDPRVFAWYIDWDSFEHVTAFTNSTHYTSFAAGMADVFDLAAAAPLTMFSRFTENAFAALTSPVTEVAFFTLPIASRAVAQPMIEHAKLGDHPVLTVGKSTGGAIAWVFAEKNTAGAVPAGASIALHGVFGYAAVADHYAWRATPEHAQVIAAQDAEPLHKLGLKDDIRMPGGNIFVPDSSMFHVKFRAS
ncbi:hypothetical protein B0H17DRAFT_1202283 [Mycena rosella]|uniref:ABM domain-containing protein n=1 Tax=Mycena rosella TaxID=1033263 RepID=A0AAD7DEP4_MYCRO|nr:hypothetical protein B0H17DRAFT_1202283 [Mycena rosella]